MARLTVDTADSLIEYNALLADEGRRVLKTVEGEILTPVEHLHRRFDEAYDRVETLSGLIEQRRTDGIDCSQLLIMLRKAEAEKKASLTELRKARWLKVVSAA